MMRDCIEMARDNARAMPQQSKPYAATRTLSRTSGNNRFIAFPFSASPVPNCDDANRATLSVVSPDFTDRSWSAYRVIACNAAHAVSFCAPS